MKTIILIAFIYLCCGLAYTADNYFKVRGKIGVERANAIFNWKSSVFSALFGLPLLLLAYVHRPFREAAIRQAQDLVRGPSIEPMMPMSLPKPCAHVSCRNFEAQGGSEVLWCEHCGSLCVHGVWAKPSDSIYCPMPPELRKLTDDFNKSHPLKSHKDSP